MKFKDLKISRKLQIGFGAILVLLIILGAISFRGFSNYREIAIDNVLMGRVQANLLYCRIQVKEYIKTQSESSVESFNERIVTLEELIKEAQTSINNPERAAKVDEMDEKIQLYKNGFAQVIELFEESSKLVGLNSQRGLKMRENLTEIMKTAFRDNDASAAYYAGRVQEHVILGRLYVYKFLELNKEEDYQRVILELTTETDPLLEILDDELQNPTRRRLFAEIKEKKLDYLKDNEFLYESINQRNDIIKNTLDKIGPEISDAAEWVKLDIKEEQDQLGPLVNYSIFGISIAAVIIALIIISIITRAIRKPVDEIVVLAEAMVEGNLDKKSNIDQKDEIGILATAFTAIQNKIANLLAENVKLINSIEEGKLDTRANNEGFEGGYLELVNGINNLCNAFVAPINVTAEYVDRISKGDIPPKITEDYKGDFNEIKNNLNQLIDVTDGLLSQTDKLIESVRNGQLDRRGNPEEFSGDWAKLLEGINNLTNAFVAPINVTAEYVDRIAKGDIPPLITDDYKGDFNEIKNNLNQAIQVMSGLLEETNGLITSTKNGQLDKRGNPDKFTGEWSTLIKGINELVDAFVAPINVTAEYVDRISKGDIPPMITEEYKGDFNEIKNNLNLCIDSINSLVEDVNTVAIAMGRAKLRQRADTSKHSGSYRDLMIGLNNALNKVTDLLDGIPLPIMAIDNQFSVMFMNKAGSELDNKAPNELEATKCFNHFKTDHCNTGDCACHQSMNTKKEVTVNTKARPGSLELDIEYTGIPIFDENNNVVGSFEVVVDQTEVKSQMRKSEAISNFQSEQADNLIEILKELSDGNLSINIDHAKANGDLKDVAAVFNKIYDGLNRTVSSIKLVTEDVNALSDNAVSGNLTYRADHNQHQGDFRSIVLGINETLNSIIEPLNEASDILSGMASGDLTLRMLGDYQGDFMKFKNDINTLGDSLESLINQVNDTVHTTASSAHEISATAESLASSSQEQSSQSEEVASAVEQMSKTITENAMNASKTAEVAERSGQVANSGGEIVQQTIKKMRDISKVVTESASSISKLGESSKQIGEIISVIDDIADQTNLLALNAAIEAARAGDQGRGFAVVADEVRKLAERTTEATKQIEGMIKGIQIETDEAVVAMDRGTNEVQSGIELADKAGDSLEEILDSIKSVLDMINQIAAASEEQSATSEQISKNVVSISQVSAEAAQRIEDVAKTSDDLSQLTEHLRELMSQFKVTKESIGASGLIKKSSSNPIQSSSGNRLLS